MVFVDEKPQTQKLNKFVSNDVYINEIISQQAFRKKNERKYVVNILIAAS